MDLWDEVEAIEADSDCASEIRYLTLADVIPTLPMKWRRRVISLYEQHLMQEGEAFLKQFNKNGVMSLPVTPNKGLSEAQFLRKRLEDLIDASMDIGDAEAPLYFIFEQIFRELPETFQKKMLVAFRRAKRNQTMRIQTDIRFHL